MKKIVVDLLGGDLPLEEILKGINGLLEKNIDYKLVLVGPEEIIKQHVKYDVEIIDAKYDVESNTNPMDMMSKLQDSALMKSYSYLKNNDDAVGIVSMAGTGCVFVGALFIIGLIKGIKAAVLAGDLFNKNKEHICVLDLGANIDSTANQLVDFARIGNAYMKSYYGIESPRIGLANLGVEPKKGNKVIKAAYELISNTNLNFIGNVEFSNIFGTGHDVIVCDGLTGNTILKNTEGVAKIIMDIVSKYENTSDVNEEIFKLFSYNEQGGSFLLGVNKIVVKAHGACNASTIEACISQAINLDKGNFISNLKKEFEND